MSFYLTVYYINLQTSFRIWSKFHQFIAELIPIIDKYF